VRSISASLLRPFATIVCRLDWCNSLLYGLPQNLPRKVESVQHAAARLFTNTGRRDHITPVLRQLHSLSVQNFRDEWSSRLPACAPVTSIKSADVPHCRHSTHLRAWSPLNIQQHTRRTVFLPTSLHQLLYRLSRVNLNHFCLPNLSNHFKLLSRICVPCPRSYLAYATLISTFYYYYYYYYYSLFHGTQQFGDRSFYCCGTTPVEHFTY